jgi:hypothetical protein
MPRLTSYRLLARSIIARFRFRSMLRTHAPGPVPGDASTDKLPLFEQLDPLWNVMAIVVKGAAADQIAINHTWLVDEDSTTHF